MVYEYVLKRGFFFYVFHRDIFTNKGQKGSSLTYTSLLKTLDIERLGLPGKTTRDLLRCLN